MQCLYNNKNYENQSVGGYKVIEYSHEHFFPSGQKTQYWKVRCLYCDREKCLSRQKIIFSHQQGCQYCVKNRFNKSDSWNWKGNSVKNVPAMYFHKTKSSAAKRNLNFSISREDMEEKFLEQIGKCAYTNIELFFGDSKNRGTASIDRIDSSKGYIKENIQWVHKDVNLMKMDLSHDRFLEICKIITEKNK